MNSLTLVQALKQDHSLVSFVLNRGNLHFCPTVVYLQLKVEGTESLLAVVSLKQVFRAVLNTAADRLCDFHKHGTELTQSALDEFRSVQSGIQA